MYFYQTLNQFGPSAVGFPVWKMSSAVEREEQGEAAPREQRGAGLRAPSLWGGNSLGRWKLGGFCIFQREFALRETLLSCPGARWQRRVGKGMWDGFVVPTLGIAQVGHWEVKILLRSELQDCTGTLVKGRSSAS